MNDKDKSPTPLSVMTGSGQAFTIKEKKYAIKPIKLMDVETFMQDNLSLGTQIFNLADKNSREKLNKYLTEYCFDEENNPVSLEKASCDGWDIVDLKEFIKKLCDLSG